MVQNHGVLVLVLAPPRKIGCTEEQIPKAVWGFVGAARGFGNDQRSSTPCILTSIQESEQFVDTGIDGEIENGKGEAA